MHGHVWLVILLCGNIKKEMSIDFNSTHDKH